MSVDQAQFDADLKALTDSIATLIAAVEALPTSTAADFTAEDAAVKDAAAAVQAELDKLSPPA